MAYFHYKPFGYLHNYISNILRNKSNTHIHREITVMKFMATDVQSWAKFIYFVYKQAQFFMSIFGLNLDRIRRTKQNLILNVDFWAKFGPNQTEQKTNFQRQFLV